MKLDRLPEDDLRAKPHQRSASRLASVRDQVGWQDIVFEMVLSVVSSSVAVDAIGHCPDAVEEAARYGGFAPTRGQQRFADDLGWWAQASYARYQRLALPY